VTQHSDPGEKLPDEAGPIVMAFSHDVVNPLMSILALTQVLLLENRPDDRLNEDLRRIHDAAEEALGLVRSLSLKVAGARRHPPEF
jgi:signal transduction histidine kinase